MEQVVTIALHGLSCALSEARSHGSRSGSWRSTAPAMPVADWR